MSKTTEQILKECKAKAYIIADNQLWFSVSEVNALIYDAIQKSNRKKI